MIGEGIWGLRACLVVHRTGVTLTAHRGCLDICSMGDFRAIHTHTLEPSICVNAHLILGAVVLSGGTFINIFAAAPITGRIVSNRTGTAVASRCVHTSMQTQSPSLAVMEQLTFIYISADVAVPARDGVSWLTGAVGGPLCYCAP